jgi:hypothetical protein
MATPGLPIKPSNLWKRVAIISFFGGVGFAFAVVVIVGSFIWYKSRPMPPMPWNKTAVKAYYTNLSVVFHNAQSYFDFRYSLDNSTDSDYEIPSEAKVMIRLAGDKSYRVNSDLSMEQHVFIPSHQKVNISLKLLIHDLSQKDADDKTVFRSIIGPKLKEIDGFALFDQSNRYQIDFPSVPETKKALEESDSAGKPAKQ